MNCKLTEREAPIGQECYCPCNERICTKSCPMFGDNPISTNLWRNNIYSDVVEEQNTPVPLIH